MMRNTSIEAPTLVGQLLGALLLAFALRSPAADLCPKSEPREVDGVRRVALLVGVGAFKNANVPKLAGAPNDAQQMYDLLTGAKGQGFGFPKENVCLLLDNAATVENMKKSFDRVLVNGVREGKNDVAVFYFAGHGSQQLDLNDDEPDRCDETFLFHDSRTGTQPNRIGDLVDDDFNLMLTRLYKRTRRVVVILDSCNSGTATRGASDMVARFSESDGAAKACPKVKTVDGKVQTHWAPQAMPELVVLTAASDGTSALETKGHGIFTGALAEVLTQGVDAPLTYAQISRQVPPLVAASNSPQIPYFQGRLDQVVFDATGKRRPFGWDVTALGETIELRGVPVLGMGKGAELRIYDGAVTGSVARDPSAAKATVVVMESTDIIAKAKITAAATGAPAIKRGDLAVMVRPSDEVLKIKVRLRPATESGGIPSERAELLRKMIKENDEAAMFIDLVSAGDNFELSMEGEQLVLRGPENNVRNRYENDGAVPDSLWQHARQKAFLNLRGEGGAEFTDQQTLKVQLVSAAKQASDARGQWKQAPPNTEQIMPLKHRWNVKVTLAEDASKPLLVGGLILSSDGSSYGLPCDGRAIRLSPGESATFEAKGNTPGCPLGETYAAGPPLNTQDHVVVFGTQEKNPVPWYMMTETARTRDARAAGGGPLYSALNRYMRPGTRGQGLVRDDQASETTWTLTSITMRVVEP